MRQQIIEAAHRERQRRAAAWADKVYGYLTAGGPNSERILAILERARERKNDSQNH